MMYPNRIGGLATTYTALGRIAVMTQPTVRLMAKAILLDMDGVLVDSTALVEEHWSPVGRAARVGRLHRPALRPRVAVARRRGAVRRCR
jgi:hypothetical protein